ncbi:hypothetical protein E4U17_002879 [Claviceps sp. LM77 group G4]|nr:hypothetical protein E4U17_002879 [Claviceps sp. LM77 group G4]KAG6070913.1 hypothetical protein E4U16_006511 [Claviceps sp. LM84 group G4]KAG6074816.1 hypothetical protein E4U33_002289 [Claviceps sp. LM78 group G4]
MYGFNANYDSTAKSQGVPQADGRLTRRADQDFDHMGNNNDPPKTEDTSVTGGRFEENAASPSDSLDKLNKLDDSSVASEMHRRSSAVQALARSYSRTSAAGGGGDGGAEGKNPYFADKDSCLNPNSPSFSGREWAKAMVALMNEDGKSFRSSGVCFQNLNVHGFGAATDFQKDVANVWSSLAGSARQLMGRGKQRIDILRNFDGLVQKGEMLVVLGPPGSGCSTFLKTIAGEMNGIYTGDGSYFNYKGEQDGEESQR